MKKIIAVLSALTLGCSLAACGKGSSSSESSSDLNTADKTIGISLPTQELERWINDGIYLKKQFEDAGYSVIMTYSDNDIKLQNADIQAMIDEDVDLLLIAAIDGTQLKDTLNEAIKRDVPVVAYDRLIMDTDAITCYVSFDNTAIGALQGQFVKEQLDLDSASGPYNIEFVGGDPGDNNAPYVFNGAYDTLAKYIEQGKLVIRSGNDSFDKVSTKNWSTETAKRNMERTLSRYYTDGTKLDVALCSNDSTALGTAQAIASSYSGGNMPIITGQDGDIENLRNIVDGKQSMTVYKKVNDEAAVTFAVCSSILSGRIPAASLVDTLSAEAVYDTDSYNNGAKYVPSYLLTPYVITRDNLQLLVDSGLYIWDESGKYLESVNS